MEDRFENNEILTLGDYQHLLGIHNNRVAKVKVFNHHKVFDIAMTYKLIDAQKNLTHLDLKWLLN